MYRARVYTIGRGILQTTNGDPSGEIKGTITVVRILTRITNVARSEWQILLREEDRSSLETSLPNDLVSCSAMIFRFDCDSEVLKREKLQKTR